MLLLARPISKHSADTSALVLGRVSVDSVNRFFPDPPAIDRVARRLVPGIRRDAYLVRLVVQGRVQRVRREEEEVLRTTMPPIKIKLEAVGSPQVQPAREQERGEGRTPMR